MYLYSIILHSVCISVCVFLYIILHSVCISVCILLYTIILHSVSVFLDIILYSLCVISVILCVFFILCTKILRSDTVYSRIIPAHVLATKNYYQGSCTGYCVEREYLF